MTRHEELTRELERLEREIASLPEIDMTVEEFAAEAGISVEQATLIARGETDEIDITTTRRTLPFMATCPLCGTVRAKQPAAKD
jgi:hypothetical protein